MMKKLLIGLVVLIVLAVVAVLIGPSFVDWSQYKDQIAQQARQATGRELAIDGGISLSILPAPKLSVEKVRLSNIEGGSAPDMASFGSLEVRVAFAPFDWYSGNFQITRIDLVEPTILLERLADGRTNWTFASKEAETPPTTGGGGAPAIRLDNVTIQDGTLIYRDAAAGSEQKVTALNATLGAESLNGPFRAEGSLTYGALPVLFKLAAGALGGERPAEIDAELGLAKSDATVKFAGTVATAPALAVKGKLDAGTGNLATTLNALAPGSAAGLPLALDKAFKVAGDVAYADTGGGVQNLAVSLDDMTATGAVNFTPGTPAKAEAKLALNRLDLDKLLAAAAAAPAEATPAATPSAGGGFALPADLDASLELGIDAIAYKGGVVNDAELKAELSKGELNLTKASALLPGGSSFSIAGTLAAAEGQPKFTGALEGKSDNLRGLLEWLQVALPQVPADRLRQLALTSRVNATPGTVEIADLDLTLDSSRITGGTTIALPGANRAKPAFGVGLAIDQINVDGYLPPAAAEAPQPAAAEAKSAGLPLDGLKPLADIDANVELRVGKLTVNEQTLQGVHVDGLLQGGNLTLRDLSVKEFAGGKGALSGTVTGLAAQPRFETKFNLSAKDAGRAFQLAGLGKAPGQLGALKLDGTLAGGAQDVAYDVTFSIAGVGAQGAAKGKATGIGAGIPRVDTTFNLQAKDAGPLFGLAGLSAADGSKLGAVAINGTAQSGANDLAYDVSLSAAGIGGQGKLTGKLTELTGTPKVDTRLDFNAQKPAPILALAGMAGPTASKAGALGVSGTMAGNADSMKLDLDLNGFGGGASLDGTVSAAKAPTSFDLALTANHPEFRQLLSALVAGYQPSATELGAFSLKAKANGSTQLATLSGLSLQAGQTRLDGDLKLDQTKAKPFLTANLKGGVVDVTPFTPPGKSQKTASGGQRWSNEPLDLSALDSFDADVDFTADSFISGATRIDNLKTKLSLRDGTLTIAQLNGNTYGGAVDLTGQLVSRGVPTFTGKVVADKVSVSDLAGTGLAKGPVSFNADVQSRGRSMAELMGGLQGKGRVDGTVTVLGKLEQAVGAAALGVAGQQLAKLTGITQVQSVTGYLNAAYQAFVGRPNALTGDFTITRGVLNTQNLTLANDQAKALATGDANLSAWTIAMLVNLFSAQFPDQPCLKVDLAGILDSPTPKPRGGGSCGGSAATGTTNVLGGFGQLLGGAIPGTAPAGQAVSPTDAIGGAVGGALGGALGGILGGKKKDSGAAQQPQAPATTKKVAPAQQQPQAPAATAPAQQQPQTPATGRKKNQQTAPAAPATPAQQPPAAVTPPPAEAAPEQPAASPPAAEQPAPEPPAAEQPAPAQPAPEQPAAEQPAPAQPEQPAAEQPAPAPPAPEQPAPEQPAAEQPSPAQPAPEQPAQPAPEQPAQPAPEQPAAEQPPATDQPTVPPTEEQQQQQQ